MYELEIIIIIILLIILIYYVGLFPTLLIGLSALVLYNLQSSAISKKGGDWDCIPESGEYGNRCWQGNEFDNKEECETYCLNTEEKMGTIENIRKFVFDRGYVFPVPLDFLENIKPKDLRDFERKHYFSYMAFYMRFIRKLYSKILKDYFPQANIIRVNTFPLKSYKDLLIEKMIHCPLKGKERILKLLEQPENTWIAENLNIKDSITEIFNHKDLDIIDILEISSLGSNSHANAAVIYHKYRKIYYFEPHIGNKYDVLYDPVVKLLEPLGYEVISTDTCPVGLQSVTGDGYCKSWSLFGTFLFMLNPDKNPREVLNYFIGQRKYVKSTLNLFLYYLYQKYNNWIQEQKPYDITKEEIRLQIEQLENIRQITEHFTTDIPIIEKNLKIIKYTITNIKSELYNLIRNYDKMKNKDFFIFTSVESYIEKTKQIIDNLEFHPQHSQQIMEEYFDMIHFHFDLDKYGRKIHEAQPECILF